MYVIVRICDGKYVVDSRLNLDESFTTDLTKAAFYSDYKKAVANCCGDERIVKIESQL